MTFPYRSIQMNKCRSNKENKKSRQEKSMDTPVAGKAH